MKLFKRFMAYYIPFLKLFILDIAVAAFSSVLSILFPLLTRYLLNEPIPNRDYNMMIIIFAIMIAVYIIQAVSNYIRIRWGHILGVRMENKMREELFAHLQTLSFSYFDKTKTGTIMSRTMIWVLAHFYSRKPYIHFRFSGFKLRKRIVT